MRFTIITHVPHKAVALKKYSAYGPYVKEMNLWLKYVDSVNIVAPLSTDAPNKIDIMYNKEINLVKIKEINLTGIKEILKSILYAPYIFFKILRTISNSDHIHLRCPGNIGLIGCVTQIFYPRKHKSAKYAGNWDNKSHQPWSYRLQKWILNNTFLTRNMQVMVYGNWQESSKNVVPFFTASYHESDKIAITPRNLTTETIKLIFVGALSEGKRPLLSVQIAEELIKKNKKIQLDIFGDGALKNELSAYIRDHNLKDSVFLHGNQSAELVSEYYRNAHFLIFLSKSEGWPKVVAESMWWGCLPITTAVSCVPEMLGNESRGTLIAADVTEAINAISNYIQDPDNYYQKSEQAMNWSRQFTMEKFESSIELLLKHHE